MSALRFGWDCEGKASFDTHAVRACHNGLAARLLRKTGDQPRARADAAGGRLRHADAGIGHDQYRLIALQRSLQRDVDLAGPSVGKAVLEGAGHHFVDDEAKRQRLLR